MRARFDLFRFNIVNFDKEHIRMFFRSPLWVGLPFVVALTFALLLLIVLTISGQPFVELWQRVLSSAAVVGLAWIIGIWSATCREEEEGGAEESSRLNINLFRVSRIENEFLSRLVWWLCAILLFALICSSQIEDIIEGVKCVAYPIAGIVSKAISIAAVLVPVYLHERMK